MSLTKKDAVLSGLSICNVNCTSMCKLVGFVEKPVFVYRPYVLSQWLGFSLHCGCIKCFGVQVSETWAMDCWSTKWMVHIYWYWMENQQCTVYNMLQEGHWEGITAIKQFLMWVGLFRDGIENVISNEGSVVKELKKIWIWKMTMEVVRNHRCLTQRKVTQRLGQQLNMEVERLILMNWWVYRGEIYRRKKKIR